MRNPEEYMNMNYRFSLRKDEDGDYIAEVDEFPGCIADGPTPTEAIENLHSAMESWIASRQAAGLEVPMPRDTVEFSGKFLVRLPKSLHRKISDQAAREGVSLNQHVVSVLSESCGRSQVAESQNAQILTPVYGAAKLLRIYGPAEQAARGHLWKNTGYTRRIASVADGQEFVLKKSLLLTFLQDLKIRQSHSPEESQSVRGQNKREPERKSLMA